MKEDGLKKKRRVSLDEKTPPKELTVPEWITF